MLKLFKKHQQILQVKSPIEFMPNSSLNVKIFLEGADNSEISETPMKALANSGTPLEGEAPLSKRKQKKLLKRIGWQEKKMDLRAKEKV